MLLLLALSGEARSCSSRSRSRARPGDAGARASLARGVDPGVIVGVSLGGRGTLAALRAHCARARLVGLLNTAVPFWLLSWGETRIDSGLASIIQASVPIFNVLLAYGFFHEQRVAGGKVVGVAVGFVGVALLVGAQPEGKILGALAVVGMAVCYAAGGLLSRRYLASAPPPVVALGTSAVAACRDAPGRPLRAPGRLPGWKTIVSVVVLGVVGTAFAYLLFFTLIAGAGAAYASFVTYLSRRSHSPTAPSSSTRESGRRRSAGWC